MKFAGQCILVATLVFVLAPGERRAAGQIALRVTRDPSPQGQSLQPPAVSVASETLKLENRSSSSASPEPEVPLAPHPLFEFRDSDIKFKLKTLMNILRDSRHESWVLAAYPDPKTKRPLIGAGFSLDVMAAYHIQRDPLNPYSFIEPSSSQLWLEAGLDLGRLQDILDQFDRNQHAWKKEDSRRRVRSYRLLPELTEEEATSLLRISAIQAIHNARAYCRGFDRLMPSQQMALSQLVFQMGVNLEEFVHFLGAINDFPSYPDLAQSARSAAGENEHWKTVQRTLIQSDWARRYTSRAVAVIAMFDPDYDKDPSKAERQVRTRIRPLVTHHRNQPQLKSVRAGRGTSHIDRSR